VARRRVPRRSIQPRLLTQAPRSYRGDLPPISIVLVDDEHLIRSTLASGIREAGLDLVGEADTAADAVRLVVELRPDVVLMDHRLPGSQGVVAVEQLASRADGTRILILTRAEHNLVIEAIVAGACGYILKSSPVAAIIAAVVATARGEVVISSTIAERLLTRIRERDSGVTAGGEDAARAIVAALTPRELEIFTRLAGGASNRDIGRELSLSRSTVANHLASILDKLHLENRVQAAVQAVRCGLA